MYTAIGERKLYITEVEHHCLELSDAFEIAGQTAV